MIFDPKKSRFRKVKKMKKITGVFCALALAAGTIPAVASDDAQELRNRLTNATEVLTQIMGTPDKGIPESILAGAS